MIFRNTRRPLLITAVLTTSWAANAVAQDEEIFAPYPGPCVEAEGYDGGTSRIVEHQYDESGNRISSAQDRDADGTVDSRVQYTYDAEGRLNARLIDVNGDGEPDERVALSYDAEGRLSERRYFRGGEEPDSIGRFTYTAEGLLSSQRTEDTEGEIFEIGFERDATGRITAERTMFQRSDGHYDEGVVTYEYNEAGRRSAIDRDNDGDGNTDVRIEYAYNEAGAVETASMVRGGGRLTRYSYACFGGTSTDEDPP